MRLNKYQKQVALEALLPCNDWVIKTLNQIDEHLQNKIDAVLAGADDFEAFCAVVEASAGLTQEETERHNRIANAILRRHHQLMRREDAIRAMFTPDEMEQSIVS